MQIGSKKLGVGSGKLAQGIRATWIQVHERDDKNLLLLFVVKILNGRVAAFDLKIFWNPGAIRRLARV